MLVDDRTELTPQPSAAELTWPRFALFFFGTLAVAVIAGLATPFLLGPAWGVRLGSLFSLGGAMILFHFSFRRPVLRAG